MTDTGLAWVSIGAYIIMSVLTLFVVIVIDRVEKRPTMPWDDEEILKYVAAIVWWFTIIVSLAHLTYRGIDKAAGRVADRINEDRNRND